jgi:hypothetical protein
MPMTWRCTFLLLLLGWLPRAAALAPHELLLAINQNSPPSLELANRYAALRGLPPENFVYLDAPTYATEISTNDFLRQIWQPLEAALHERRLLGRILGVAYSCDFPTRVSGAPALSLTGATFGRGAFPPPGLVATGLYASAFFAGPARPDAPSAPSRSLGWFRDAAPPTRLLPLPAMLLAHTGARGLEPGEVFQSLEKAALSVSNPWKNGAFLLHTNSDLRSKMRDWQFADAAAELVALGAQAFLTNAPPAAAAPVLGFMTGAANPAPPVCAFIPGAYADHCTSFAGRFDGSDQIKLTAWLRGGAATSSGTVVEPYSIWTKFPNARFFAHQVRGCSALECFALSVRCPFQLLAIGDPLAAPGAPRFSARLTMRAEGPRLAALLKLAGASTNVTPRYSFFIDGREVEHLSAKPGIQFELAKLPDGYHRLLGVAVIGDSIRFTAQAGDGIVVNNGGKMPTLSGVAAGARVAGDQLLKLQITAPILAREVGVLQGERLLARGTERALTLDPARLGAGPVELQAIAWYADGPPSRGEPVAFEILRAVPPPEPGGLVRRSFSEGGFQGLENFPTNFPSLGKLELTATGAVAFSTTNDYALVAAPAAARELAVTLTPANASLTRAARAGLVFNFRDERNFDFFGLVGETSAWTLAQVREGKFATLAARGWPVRQSKDYRLGVRAGTSGVECLVNREMLFGSDKVKLETAPAGVGVSGAGAVFAGFAVWPAKEKP